MKKKSKSNFGGKVASNATKQKNQESNYGYLILPKDIKIFKEKEGKNKLDIIPYTVSDVKHPDRDPELDTAMPETLWYRRPFKVHKNVGASNDSLVCPTTWGGKCPICEYRAKRMKEGADKEETDRMKVSQRNLYLVVPIGIKGFEEELHVWDTSQFLFQELLNKEIEEDPSYGVFPDIEEGLTLHIRFDEETFQTYKFFRASRIDFKERELEYDEEFLDAVPDLDAFLKRRSYAEIEALFFEEDLDDDDEDNEQEEAPETKKPLRKKKTVAPEEEPEEEVEESEEEPEPKKPVRKAPARTVKKPKVEEEPEEEPEPKKPVRRSSTAPTKTMSKPSKSKCPHGYEFGKDCEEYDECDSCDVWDACMEAKEALD